MTDRQVLTMQKTTRLRSIGLFIWQTIALAFGISMLYLLFLLFKFLQKMLRS